jgi:hypothetical protein
MKRNFGITAGGSEYVKFRNTCVNRIERPAAPAAAGFFLQKPTAP